MTVVLLSAFEPFDGEAINPSAEAVRVIIANPLAGLTLVHAILPVTYAGALPALEAAVERHRPDYVIAVGQAGGRPDISIERVAINVDDGRIPDNAGVRRIDTPVIEGAPNAYFSSLPIKAITQEIRDAGIPARVSQTAGTFLCNHIFFGLCHLAATSYPKMRGGFVHVPYLPEQAARHPGQPSMALESIVTAIRVAALVSAREEADLRVAEGTTH